jgi:hypothetical protein
VCSSKDFEAFFELPHVPVNVGIQWPTYEQSLQCPKGDINLAFCRSCGFVWNLKFDPTHLDYSQDYDNSLFFSPLFRRYTESLISRLINRYDLRNKNVIEIGCGKGDFLSLICELGNNWGVGFDTTFEGLDQEATGRNRIRIIQDFYCEKYAEYEADLICSRFVFEHIEQPRAFLQMLRRAIGDRREVLVYFEVPNVSLILRDLSVWDIVYEHCSYFGSNSLRRIFTLCGFEVLDLYEGYEGQFLGIEAKPCNNQSDSQASTRSADELGEITAEVDSFVDNSRKQLDYWQRQLKDIEDSSKRVVLWGAGAKGVGFLNMLKIREPIKYVVDINPRKHGKFMPGTGQEIVPPEFLVQYQPQKIIVMNPVYGDEIQRDVDRLGVDVHLLTV